MEIPARGGQICSFSLQSHIGTLLTGPLTWSAPKYEIFQAWKVCVKKQDRKKNLKNLLKHERGKELHLGLERYFR